MKAIMIQKQRPFMMTKVCVLYHVSVNNHFSSISDVIWDVLLQLDHTRFTELHGAKTRS